MLLIGSAPEPTLESDSARVTLIRSGNEWVEELYAKDAKGTFHLVLTSPTHPLLKSKESLAKTTLLSGVGSSGLFNTAPTFGFSDWHREGNSLVLTSMIDGWAVTKTLTLDKDQVRISLHADTKDLNPKIRYFLNTYAFVPDGKLFSKGGKPDTTWAPAIRPRADGVIGDHFFRSPAVVAQKGGLSAIILPDIDLLKEKRPIPTILDLDCKSGVVDAPLMSYGLCDYRLVGHVYFAQDASMIRPTPWSLDLGMTVMLGGDTPAHTAYEKASDYNWERYGSAYFNKVYPQARPFGEYAKECYPAALNEKETGGWFERSIDGQVCGGMASGWGRGDGWVSWQAWFNQLRSAWGMRWWGIRDHNADWVDKADKMLNLALAAPMNQGACPTTYQSKEGTWKGSLITPSADCYYDLTNIAWKGIWMLRWLDFPDCPRRAEIEKQVSEMAQCIMRAQNPDGSVPSWLTKDLKTVPILDRSAQTGLPIWFLGNYAQWRQKAGDDKIGLDKINGSVHRGADFLMKEVVDGQYYYDFETFFSCSPKECHQRAYTFNHEEMRDPHTLQAPQNTLCMQWTAEALRVAAKLDHQAGYMEGALKALDTMCLYQNVWPISYRPVAYTYGGFGVQNSDGEYNDARQAQFGETLCDFGAQLGRKDYFQRGVAATRGSLTLINDQLHASLGIYPNPNYPIGLQPENCGHGGGNEQDGRTGFDWGEGSGLASAALLIDKYGEGYSTKNWSVGIDGLVDEGGKFLRATAWDIQGGESSGGRAAMSLYRPAPAIGPALVDAKAAFDFSNPYLPGWKAEGTIIGWPTRSNRLNFNAAGLPFIGTCEDGHGSYDDELLGSFTSPLVRVAKQKLQMLVGGGSLEGTYVEVLDSHGHRLSIQRGKDNERMDERVIDLSSHVGETIQIRIVDREKGGWGHINVGNIRFTD